MAIDEGLYELRSTLLTSMCVTGSGYTAVKGSNVFLYSWNDSNNRKWNLDSTASGWRLQNAANGLYMTLGSSTPANGVNVRQWTSSTNSIQYWNVIDTGDTYTLDGYACPIVKLGSYATSGGTTWMLDVDKAMTTNSSNMEINSANSADSQLFVLFPSALLNNSYPVPASVGWSASTSNNPYINHAGAAQDEMLIGWVCPSTWVPDNTKGFERRVRTRLMNASTSTWGSWSQWSQWADVDPYMRGSYCYDLNTVDGSFSTSTYKAKEVQAEVRCKTATAHGQSATRTMRCIVDPTATITIEGVTTSGIALGVASDYNPAYYTIKSIEVGGNELLAEPMAVDTISGDALLTLSWEGMKFIPSSGSVATVRYSRGTDLFASIGGGSTKSASITISYGTAPSVAPTISSGDGMTLSVSHGSGVTSVWSSDGAGITGGSGSSGILYPFGKALRVLVTLGDGTVYVTDIPALSSRAVHAFNWSGGYFLLELREGEPLSTEMSVERDAETFSLNEREWESVHYAVTKSGSIDVDGAIVYGVSESSTDDLDALVEQGYVTYRSPFGIVADVAVTGYRLTEYDRWAEVSISMVRVTN